MFSGLSALIADLVFVIGPVLIGAAEAPRFFGWLERRRLDPIRHPALAAAAAASIAPVRITTAGLLDPDSTDRIVPRDFTAEAPPAPPAAQSVVLVGAGGARPEPRVRPSIRNPRS